MRRSPRRERSIVRLLAAALASLVLATPAYADPDGWLYSISLWNRTCGSIEVTLKSDQIGCQDVSGGCKFTIPYTRARAFSILFRSRVDVMKVSMKGNCSDGGPAGVVRGFCDLPLTKMFPWLGYNVVFEEIMDPWPYLDDSPATGLILDRETPSSLAGGPTEVDVELDQCTTDPKTGINTCTVYCRPLILQPDPKAVRGTDPYSNLDWCPADADVVDFSC